MWVETKKAIQAAIAAGKQDGEFVFYRKCGASYRGGDHVGHTFRYVAEKAGVAGTFYDLRRTFQTVAENASDQIDLPAIH